MRNIHLLNAANIAKILESNPTLVKDETKRAFEAHHHKLIRQPSKQYLRRNATVPITDRVISMPAYINNRDDSTEMVGIKWIGSHPENYKRGLQRANALIIVNHPETNAPMAILDGSQISTERTFAVSLVGIDALCPDIQSVAVIGMGKLGRLHASMLPKLYPSLKKVYCYSNTANYNDILSDQIMHCSSWQEAISKAEVVITTTSATKPYINYKDVADMRLIVNQSVMDFDIDVYAGASQIVIDDWDECFNAKSAFTHAVNQCLIKRDDVIQIGEILFNQSMADDGLKLFSPLGMAVEDIVIASAIYNKALQTGLYENFAVA